MSETQDLFDLTLRRMIEEGKRGRQDREVRPASPTRVQRPSKRREERRVGNTSAEVLEAMTPQTIYERVCYINDLADSKAKELMRGYDIRIGDLVQGALQVAQGNGHSTDARALACAAVLQYEIAARSGHPFGVFYIGGGKESQGLRKAAAILGAELDSYYAVFSGCSAEKARTVAQDYERRLQGNLEDVLASR